MLKKGMNALAPLTGTIIYLSYPWNSKSFILLHNACLQVYSTWTWMSLSYALYMKGFHVERNYYMSDPWINTLVFYFYLSKYYEYLDTFILYAKGKEPIFLQKYHHVGAVLCWHICWINNVDATLYASLVNSFIHSIMYLYYFLHEIGVKLTTIKPYITYLQMLQFVSGFTSIYYWYPIESDTNKLCIIFFLIYNLGLIVLFSKFIRDTYMVKSKPRQLSDASVSKTQ